MSNYLSAWAPDVTKDWPFWRMLSGFRQPHVREAVDRGLRASARKSPPRFVRCGNTCSATIPMVLEQCARSGRFQPGQRLVLVGFGVVYSWAATLIEWKSG